MLHLTSGPAVLVEIGLAIFCFVDALIAPEAAVRWIPRWAWVLFVLAFPACASILWIFAGRSWRSRVRTGHLHPAREAVTTARPDDLPDDRAAGDAAPSRAAAGLPAGSAGAELADDLRALNDLREANDEHEKTLLLWEADLRRREELLRAARRTPGAA
jgi:hypothetical protein